jgi:hypothetical protein
LRKVTTKKRLLVLGLLSAVVVGLVVFELRGAPSWVSRARFALTLVLVAGALWDTFDQEHRRRAEKARRPFHGGDVRPRE